MFANLKRLENLDLPGCSLTIQNLQALKHLGQLKKIDLSSIEHLNIFLDQITMLRNWLMENKSKQLDHLEIHTVHYRNCSNAEILVDIGKLFLPNNNEITDPALEALLTFQDLQEISVIANGLLRLTLLSIKRQLAAM